MKKRRKEEYPIYTPTRIVNREKETKMLWAFSGFAKVMAIADGYAMLRFKGCIPFVKSVNDLESWKKHGCPGELDIQ